MKRSPSPFSRYPPAPRKPSSSTVPVIRVCGPASSPVGWNCTISMSRSGRPAAQRHRQAVAALVARRRVIAVHRRAAAGGEQHRLRLAPARTRRCACRPAARRRAPSRRAVRMNSSARCSSSRSMPRAHTCSDSRLMISMPVRSPLCTVRSNVWPGEGLLVHGAVGIAVEKAAELVLELVHALDRAVDQRPREILVGQPLAAFDRVHEMALDRIAGGERDVVAALDHARAAAFAEQALDGDGDRQRRVGGVRVQRGEQARAARAEDQDVGLEPPHSARRSAACRRRAPRARAARLPRASASTDVVQAAAVAVHRHAAAGRSRGREISTGSRD